jgi:sulfotransferase
MNYHFISGLPRSGSTLLAALLRQNPRFHADITSPVSRLYSSLLAGMSAEHETFVQISATQRKRLIHGLFDNYYEEIAANKPIIFDTSRAWASRLVGIRQLFPDARAICLVRDVAWVVDSLERLAAQNPYQPSALFGYDPEGTVMSRVDHVLESSSIVGFALAATKQAFYGADAERVLFVRYERLVAEPHAVLARLYEFLGEAPFAHDIDSVEFEAEAFDRMVQTPGLHRVRRGISFEPRRSLLPPDVFERLSKLSFWSDPDSNPHGVEVL